MIRFAIIIAVMVLVYCGVLITTAMMSGAVTQDDLDALFGSAPTEPANTLPGVDQLNATARLLQDREKLLDEREAALDSEADRLEQETVELQNLVGRYEELLEEINAALDTDDLRRQQSYMDISESLQAMDPKKAAQTLIEMVKDKPEIVPLIVKEIPKRQRGAILDNVDPEINKDLFIMLQEPAF